MKTLITITLLFCILTNGMAQNKCGKTYDQNSILQDRYGIPYYDDFIFRLAGDSIRKCKGYATNGTIRDYYKSGKMMHEGYYVDGQLHNFRNYFPNGEMEREFRLFNDIKSTMTVYFNNGKIKSKVIYKKRYPMIWEDFHEDGTYEFYEEYDKKIKYLIAQKYYYDTGKPKTIMELINKKKLEYNKLEYYPNGNLKAEGTLVYSFDILDYKKTGLWKEYDEKGNLLEKNKF